MPPVDYAENAVIANDAANSILGNLPAFTLASVVDAGTSLWNSLPLTENKSTEEILGRVSADALSIYREHPDTVQAISFIGSSLAIGGIGMKMLGLLRNGVTAAGYASNEMGASLTGTLRGSVTGGRQLALEKELGDSFRLSGSATTEYKALTRQIYAANAIQAVADNAVIEVAVVGALNAHPWMEDYIKDPLPNFGLSMLVGGVLGGALAIPISNAAIGKATGHIALEVKDKILTSGYRAGEYGDLTTSAQYQRYTENIKVLRGLLETEPKESMLRSIADTLLLKEEAGRIKALEAAAPGYKELPDTLKNVVANFFGDNAHIGVDKAHFVNLDKVDFKNTATIRDSLGDMLKTGKKGVVGDVAFARLADDGSFEVFHSSGVKNATRAVDIPGIEKQILSGNKYRTNFFVPIKNVEEDNLFRNMPAGRQDARVLTELYDIQKVQPGEISTIAVHPLDLARQNALVSWLQKQTPDQLDKTVIKVTSDYPSYAATQNYIKATVGADHMQNMKRVAEDRAHVFANKTLSPRATDMLGDWVHGSMTSGNYKQADDRIRRVFEFALRNTTLPESDFRFYEAAWGITSVIELKRVAQEIFDAGESARNAFRQHADANGFVYLYRGIKGKLQGNSAVDSFTPNVNVGTGFGAGKVNMHQVHVDNIIGTLGSGPAGEAEILVTNPHHQVVNGLPTMTATNAEVQLPVATIKMSPADMLGLYTKTTEETMKELMRAGFSMEEVVSRTNATKESVFAVANGLDLADYATHKEWRRYTDGSADAIKGYLDPKHKIFQVQGNPRKNPFGEALAAMDNNSAAIAHREQFAQLTAASNSDIAKRVLGIYDSAEMRPILNEMHTTLAEINNVLVGDPRWQSADNALRKLQNGPLIGYLGKQIIDASDNMKKKYLEPIAGALVPLTSKPAALAELNHVFNRLAELKGWRDVAQLEDGTWTIVQKVEGLLPNGKKGLVPTPIQNADKSIFHIAQPEVVDFLNSTRTLTSQLYSTHNLTRTLTGQAPIQDLGFWLPPINLVNKSYAFVMDTTGKLPVRLLVASKGDELESLITAFNRAHPETFKIVRKGEQDDFNLAKGFSDYEAFTAYANIAYQHKGASASAVPYTDARMVENIMSGYENLILQSSRKYSEAYLTDSMSWLDKMSAYYRKSIESQPHQPASKEYVPDSAMTVKNILLGRDQLEQSPSLKKINTLVDTLLSSATNAVDRFLTTTKIDSTNTQAYYDGLNAQLKAAGVTQPIMGSFQEYLAGSIPQTKNLSHNLISAGNGMMATMMLRMMELAQPAVNMMSLPILTTSALMDRLPKTVINARGDSMVLPLRQMYDGIRSMFDPSRVQIEKMLWEPNGLINQTVRQYNEVVGTIHQAQFGKAFTEKAIDALQKFQNSKAITLMSSASDYAEVWTRRFAMHTGFDAAKTAYPGISDLGATIFASNFADRAIGNYYAAQRPTLFQGSFGSGIGLFQTYFLTYAQSIYRGLEERNFKQLASTMLAQTGLFGISSWPGFNLLSENIVAHFSDKHMDITKGTFRAVNNPTAEMILYGLPSSMGPAFYTRGDISPRIPSTMTDVAVLNGIKEGYSALYGVLSAVTKNVGTGNGTQALFEALSLQSLNRPIARWSELVTGYSVTRNENTVSPTAEVWSPMGIAARLLSTRPLEEQVVRNVQHLNRYYNAMDHDRRQATMELVKVAVRNGNLDDQVLGRAAFDYIREGGSAKGWRSALNQVLIEAPGGARLDLLRKLEADNPLNKMIQENF